MESQDNQASVTSCEAQSAQATRAKAGLEEFAYRQNVVRYSRLLRATPEGFSRRILVTLLEEEAARAKLEGWTPIRG